MKAPFGRRKVKKVDRVDGRKAHLAEIVDQAGEVKPVQVRMLLPDGLGGLKRVDDVGHIGVRIALVHEVVQFDQGVLHRHLDLVEPQPILHASCGSTKAIDDQ